MIQKHVIYLGADHGGFALKEDLKKRLADYELVDVGDATLQPDDDYPLFSLLEAGRILEDQRDGRVSLGILICRSAEGMIISANKIAGISAAVATDPEAARLAREHNGATILALPGDRLEAAAAEEICRTFLAAAPSTSERHERRRLEIARIDAPHVEVIPGIFEMDRDTVVRRLNILGEITDAIHVDVADGTFVPTKALSQPDDVTGLTLPQHTEVHLMVNHAEPFVRPWVGAGTRRLIGHVETPGFADFLESAKRAEAEVVGALDLGGDVSLLEKYLPRLGGVLLMTVKAGKSSQTLDTRALQEMAQLADRYPDLRIEADGGIHLRTIPAVAAAGASLAVATSALSEAPDPASALNDLETLWRHYHA